MRIIGERFNVLLNVVRQVVALFREAVRSKQDAKRAEQLSKNGKFIEAVSLGNKILARWSSPSSSFLERQLNQWAMGDRLKRLREQLNTWQPEALIEYNTALRQADQIAVQGRFQEAIAQFEPVHCQFPQAGGEYLCRELHRIVDGKRHLQQGLLAEKAGEFEVAAEHYQNAAMYVPQLKTQCCVRLGILAIKTNNWTQALSQLEGIGGEQAAYIRGFAYIKKENWQQAQDEWQSLEQLSKNGKFIEAVSLGNKILARWSSPSSSFLERQLNQWAMGDRLKRLREQLNTWQPEALIEYNTALRQADQIAVQGRFQEAIAQFEPVHCQFPQAGGEYLCRELHRIVDGKRHLQQGLLAEKAGEFEVAAEHYQNAAMYVPQLKTQCCVRLGILAIKTNNWTQALSQLEGIGGEQAAYIRGFAYIKKENWQQAQNEWQSLSHLAVQKQREALNTLAQTTRDRLLAMREIEECVDTGMFEAAESASNCFIQKFGHEPLVQANLEQHIAPRLEAATWEKRDWSKIAKAAKQLWMKQPDVTSLHNWVVASYYQAQTDPNELADLIIAWSTDVANLHRNPSLVNLPWRGNAPVDWGEVASDLRQKIEEQINTLADENQKNQLRELLRLDTYALELMGNPPIRGMILNDVFLTPVCYQRHRTQLDQALFCEAPNGNGDYMNRLLATLYTVWGPVIVACQDGDLVRVLQIKRGLKVSSDTEQFAYEFVSCHEGCYRLQKNRWREAFIPLKQARKLIKAHAQWFEKIDKLCETRCQLLGTIDEYQDFIQFWDELLDSQSAKRYLLEIKAVKIRALRTDGNVREAIWELQKLRYSHKQNPVVLDLSTSFIDLIRDERGLLLSFEDTHLICDWAWERQSDEQTFPVPELCNRLRRIGG